MESEDRVAKVLASHSIENLRAFLNDKANDSATQPMLSSTGGIVRGAYPELKKLRENGYSLKVLVRLFEEGGVRITATTLSRYMTKLNKEAQAPATDVRTEKLQPEKRASERRAHLTMKPDIPL